MKYEVIDNFLDKEYFDHLVTLFTDKERKGNVKMPWYFISNPDQLNDSENKPFFLLHIFYIDHQPISSHYNYLIPLLEKLEVRALIRMKANLFPNTKIVEEHTMHSDMDFSHSGAILSLNTCDGYTKLKDGTKIDSVANRILLFDAGEEHSSTTTTNDYARINININYRQ